MASGYKILEPSGKATVVVVADKAHATERTRELLERWGDYCNRNWLNDSDDVFSPEQKVKRFLDSLGYFLLLGNMQGIETDYKRVMHAKREIPVSSCPSFVENVMYASGCASEVLQQEEKSSFNVCTDRLDANAEKYEAQKPKRERQRSKFQKYLSLGIQSGEWCRVDTEGVFEYKGRLYEIDKGETQYQALDTDVGELYDMDRILATDHLGFYDMNYDLVKVRPL